MGCSYFVDKTMNELLYKYFDYGYEFKKKEMIIPSLIDCDVFRQQLNEIDVWAWHPDYSNPGIYDGTNWNVEIIWGNDH